MADFTLEELQERKAKRAEARAVEAERLKLEALQLEEKYETEGHTLGVDFDVETTAIGNFVVFKPEYAVAKKFTSAKDPGIEDVTHLVDACVKYPDRSIARAAYTEHSGIAWKLAAVAIKLNKADLEIEQGK